MPKQQQQLEYPDLEPQQGAYAAFHEIDANDHATLSMIKLQLLKVPGLTEHESRLANKRPLELVDRLLAIQVPTDVC